MKARLSISLTLILIGLVIASAIVMADGAPNPLGITPTPTPGQNLTVGVWTDKSTYMVGETMRVYFTVNQPAYIYLYDIQPDGIVRRVFPNAFSQSNFVYAGMHVLPDKPSYQFSVTYPTGVEKLQIFASPIPLSLSPSTYSYGEPFPRATPQEIQGHIMGITPTPTWAMGWTAFTITAPTYSYAPPLPYPPCYPPFFGWGFPGGSWYWEDGERHYGMPSSGWHWYFGPDDKWHFTIRFHFGEE